MNQLFLMSFVILTVFFSCNIAEECSKCLKLHLQDKFCRSDFVMEVSVKKIHHKAQTLIYHVEVETHYKLVKGTSRGKLKRIEAPRCRHSCCLDQMKKGAHYVISGTVHGKMAILNNCHSIVIKSNDITKEQQAGLDGMYESNCYCASECKASQKQLQCYNKYSYCYGYNGYEHHLQRVDLSHDYGEDTMFLPGAAEPFQRKTISFGLFPFGTVTLWFEEFKIIVDEHMGTHMDAPSSIRRTEAGGWKVDEIPINRFFGDAVVIDISERAKRNIDEPVLVQDILDWEKKHGNIKDGSIVFMYSGWDEFWGNTTAYVFGGQESTKQWRFPSFSPDVAKWLVRNRNIYGVGVDTASIDLGISQTLEAHVIFLEANIYGLEMVNNLAKIPPSGAKVTVLPIKVKGGSGGPVRIIAEFKEKMCKWKSTASLQKCE